jgi:hypothetical protein
MKKLSATVLVAAMLTIGSLASATVFEYEQDATEAGGISDSPVVPVSEQPSGGGCFDVRLSGSQETKSASTMQSPLGRLSLVANWISEMAESIGSFVPPWLSAENDHQ